MLQRDQIITGLTECLRQDPRVRAAWLEGADATQHVDEYSDIDFCCSVNEGELSEIANQAQAALSALGTLDLAHVLHRQPDFRHVTFHLADTSPYCLVDFCVWRVGRGANFIEGDEIERPLILFDHGGVFTYHSPQAVLEKQNRTARLQELKDVVGQYARLEKYFFRGDFLEAHGYYHKWLLTPLIEVLRMRYTPLHPDYYIVHISQHLPPEVLFQLEDLFKVNSTQEMQFESLDALTMFYETVAWLEGSESHKK